MCLYPRLMRNPKYKKNSKNGGVIPAVPDSRVLHVPIACGNCIECRKQKSRAWKIRLLEEIKHNPGGKFILLTFSDESISELIKDTKTTGYDRDNEIATIAMRRFLERHRKKYKKSLRHWFITELGHNGTENVHMHGIIWTDKTLEEIEDIWQYGYLGKGRYNAKTGKYDNYVNNRTINYISKYVTKTDLDHSYYKPIILTSPGIGKNYVNTKNSDRNLYNGEKTVETYRTEQGKLLNLPIYYRNKIYTEEEREQLWIQKLNKNERFINGKKYDTSTKKGLETFFQALRYHQQKNKELGYGSTDQNWEKEEYEKQLRDRNTQKRISNAKRRSIMKK